MKFNVGDVVKIVRNSERIWVIVTSKMGEIYKGTLDNEPWGDWGKYGDTVIFSSAEVIQIHED